MSYNSPRVRFFFEEDGDWAPGVDDVLPGGDVSIPVVGDVLFGLNLSDQSEAMRVVARWLVVGRDVPMWWVLVEPAVEPQHQKILRLHDEVERVFSEDRRSETEKTAAILRRLRRP